MSQGARENTFAYDLEYSVVVTPMNYLDTRMMDKNLFEGYALTSLWFS